MVLMRADMIHWGGVPENGEIRIIAFVGFGPEWVTVNQFALTQLYLPPPWALLLPSRATAKRKRITAKETDIDIDTVDRSACQYFIIVVRLCVWGIVRWPL
jgi:hypothetical protein